MEAVEANEILLGWVESHRDDWAIETPRDRVLRATFARSTRTVKAANPLLVGHYGPQVLALSRTLFEDMVVAHWMIYCRTDAWVTNRLRNQHDYSRLLWHEVMSKHQGPGYEGLDRQERHRIARRRPRLEALFGKGGEVSWWAQDIELRSNRQPGQSAYKRAGDRRNLATLISELEVHPDLEGRWGEMPADAEPTEKQSSLRWAYDVPQRLNNQMMIHHTAHGIALVTDDGSGEIDFGDDPDEEWLDQAGSFTYWTFLQLTNLMVDHYAPDLSDDMQHNCKRPFLLAFHDLSPDEIHWASNNRNLPCPCGSGWKSKNCHGR